jgi:hypothetical protein
MVSAVHRTMPQSVEAIVRDYRSGCCQATIDVAMFSDGRRFLVCTACGRVLAVEPKAERGRESGGRSYSGEWQTASTLLPSGSRT